MATVTERITDLEARRARYVAAETEVLEKGQSLSMRGRAKAFGELAEIRKAIQEIDRELGELGGNTGGEVQLLRVVPTR